MSSCCCRCWRSLRDHTRATRAVRPPRRELPRGRRPGLERRAGIARARALRRRAGAARRPRSPAPPPAPPACGRSPRARCGLSCGAQAALAAVLGTGSALGGGWLGLLAFGVLAGAVLALALRVAPAARALVRSLRARRAAPSAPSPRRLAAPPALAPGSERRPAAPHARPRAAGRRVVPRRGTHPIPLRKVPHVPCVPGGCSLSLAAAAVLVAAGHRRLRLRRVLAPADSHCRPASATCSAASPSTTACSATPRPPSRSPSTSTSSARSAPRRRSRRCRGSSRTTSARARPSSSLRRCTSSAPTPSAPRAWPPAPSPGPAVADRGGVLRRPRAGDSGYVTDDFLRSVVEGRRRRRRQGADRRGRRVRRMRRLERAGGDATRLGVNSTPTFTDAPGRRAAEDERLRRRSASRAAIKARCGAAARLAVAVALIGLGIASYLTVVPTPAASRCARSPTVRDRAEDGLRGARRDAGGAARAARLPRDPRLTHRVTASRPQP